MKLTVIRRIAPRFNQHRYVVKFAGNRLSGDILPDLLLTHPQWVFATVDRMLSTIRDARPWAITDTSIIVTLEIK